MALPEPITGDMSSGADSALIERLRADDVAAFDAFMREHWSRLVYYLADRVRARELAEDLAQESLARLWQQRRKLDPAGSALSYLYQIARNLAVDELRKVQVRRRFRDEQRRSAAVSTLTPLQLLEDREALEALRRALDALPERRREAFMLVRIQKLSIKEAAQVMGTAPQTLTNQVSSALADLRRSMKDYLE
jgi:RNA polymerase sigma-70 factor, ECF subfamily